MDQTMILLVMSQMIRRPDIGNPYQGLEEVDKPVSPDPSSALAVPAAIV